MHLRKVIYIERSSTGSQRPLPERNPQVMKTPPTKPRDLFAELNAVDLTQLEAPKEKVKKGEVVIGIMGDMSKRLLHLRRVAGAKIQPLHAELERLSAEHTAFHTNGGKCGHQGKECEEFGQKISGIMTQFQASKQEYEHWDKMFWTSIHLEFPELDEHASLAYKEGFQVVYRKDTTTNVTSPIGLLLRLLS